jgi:hypothetical protein
MQTDESDLHWRNASRSIHENSEPGSKATVARAEQKEKQLPQSSWIEEGIEIEESEDLQNG